MSTHTETLEPSAAPDTTVDAASVFGIKTKMKVPAFKTANEHVPEVDTAYRFDRDTTLAILAGFAFNRRVMVQGYHRTGKSTHIEPVSYTHLRAHETPEHLVCRLLLEKKKKTKKPTNSTYIKK